MLRPILVVTLCTALQLTACTTPASHTGVVPEADGDAVASRGDAASAPAAAAVVDDDPLVCERVVQTGTRVAQRICRRQSAIDASKRAAEEMLGEVQKRGAISTSGQQ